MVQRTERDREILFALTHHVRAMTLPQITRTWWKESKPETARTRLSILEGEDLVQTKRLLAHPELELSAPVLTWKPGDGDPDFGAGSYQLKSRWSQHPVMTLCVSATATAARLFAGHGGRLPREVERTHDIHMAAVYLLYRAHDPASLDSWTFEERLRRERGHAEMLPDVVLRPRTGQQRAIEFGGAYSKAKLLAFHAYCKERNLPYEVW